jgi:hypothetical protein
MATTTPNFGWDVPTSTDYVKDGAVAIETLGDDIDATLYTINNGSGKVGGHLVNTTTFTTAGNLVFTNVFTTAYDNYRVEVVYTQSATGNTALQMANGGVGDSAATGYTYGLNFISGTGSAFDRGSNGTSSCVVAYATASQLYSLTMNFYSPKLTANTAIQANGTTYNGSSHVTTFGGGMRTATTAYDGFVMFPPSGTFTGVARVYGYRNS